MQVADTPQARILVLLLRVGGAMLITAFGAMIMPTAWMVEIHARLGLGELPGTPVVEYLTRSISALYGFHGVLLLIVASNLARLRPVAVYLGWMNILFGLMLAAIDIEAGLPGWWFAIEGPPILALGVAILWLLRAGVRDDTAA